MLRGLVRDGEIDSYALSYVYIHGYKRTKIYLYIHKETKRILRGRERKVHSMT